MDGLATTKRLAQIVTIFALALLILAVGLNLIGPLWDDRPAPIHASIVTTPLASEQNAYIVLAEQFPNFYQQDPYEQSILNPLSIFDREAAKSWLNLNKEKLQTIDQALILGQMESQFENLIDLPPYSYFVTYNNLLLLDAKLAINENRADYAITRINDSLRFCSMVRDDNNSNLVAYLVGSLQCSKNLFFVLGWINNHTLSTSDLTSLALTLEAHNQEHKALIKVWAGEYTYTKNLLNWIQNQSFSERWHSFTYSPNNDYPLKQLIEQFIYLLAPRYAALPNRENNKYHDLMLSLTERAMQSHLCSPQKLENNKVDKSINSLLPGAWMSNQWNVSTIDSYDQYFERACLYQLWIDTLRIAIANKRYTQQYSESITSMQDLVPIFLATPPADAFQASNNANPLPLHYSIVEGQVTSIGNDFTFALQKNDDPNTRNSKISSYDIFKTCHREPNCLASPRFDIAYTASRFDVEPSVKMIDDLTSKLECQPNEAKAKIVPAKG